jgi:hypothetical protein
MTSFESWSVALFLAQDLIAAVGLFALFWQLRGATEQIKLGVTANQTSNLMAVLAIEEGVARSRAELSDASYQIGLMQDEPGAMESEALRFARLRLDEKIEQYLNSWDRLCACIIRGNVDEQTYRQDYRPGLAEIVTQYRDKLGPDTRHHNILRVHQAWAQDKSAKEKARGA